MRLILFLLFFVIIVITTSCSSSESLINYDKIELLKMDSVNFPIISQYPRFPTKYKFIHIRNFPKTKAFITTFELIDSNKQIISSAPVGGDKAITMKIVYPELAKRAEIEGIVWSEFAVDKNGNANDIKILKDIGGGCGEQVINAILKTKFYPGRLLNENIESRYRVAIQFKIIPISKEKEKELRQ